MASVGPVQHQRTFGRYRPLSYLGSGGMADVFKCELQGIGGFGKLCVIKRMKPDLVLEQGFVAMFLDEARLAARMNHPNIAQVFEIDEADGVPFIALEFIRGPTLSQLVRAAHAAGKAPIPLFVRVVADIAAGLEAAHTASDDNGNPLKLVHRDVSPQNIMVSAQGIAKILDFGVAKAEGKIARTHSGTLKGKIAYMAPEQLTSGEVDARADVYALAVCLYQCITGVAPWVGDTDVTLLTSRLNDPLKPARSLRPDVPEQLDAILAKALASVPNHRYGTAQEFYDALEGFLTSQATSSDTRAVSSWVSSLFPDIDELVAGMPLQASPTFGAANVQGPGISDAVDAPTESSGPPPLVVPGAAGIGSLTPQTARLSDFTVQPKASEPGALSSTPRKTVLKAALAFGGMTAFGIAVGVTFTRTEPTEAGAPIAPAPPAGAPIAAAVTPSTPQDLALEPSSPPAAEVSGTPDMAGSGAASSARDVLPAAPAGAPAAGAVSPLPAPADNRRPRPPTALAGSPPPLPGPPREAVTSDAGTPAADIPASPSQPAVPPRADVPAQATGTTRAASPSSVEPTRAAPAPSPQRPAEPFPAPEDPTLPGKQRVYAVGELIAACKQLEMELQVRGHFAANAVNNVTALFAKKVAARLSGGDAVELPLRDIYWFVARSLAAGSSRKDVAARLATAYEAGTLSSTRR